jgi:2-polyprenyl-3-methyl-5-hydroxy-6-metoxy-1,4-benzoquinol methylase
MSNQKNVSNKELLHYLKSLDFKSGLFDRLKVYYRPLICPFSELISIVKKGEKVGDIGCGSGQFCLLLAEFGQPSFIFGIEVSIRLVENANQLFKKYSNVSYRFEYFNGISFPDQIAEMDTIFLNDVLHHVPKLNQKEFIANLIKKMKVGARLVLKDIDKSSPFVYFNKLHDLVFAGEPGNELSFQEVRLLLEDQGIIILESFKKRMYVYPHYTIIAKKSQA